MGRGESSLNDRHIVYLVMWALVPSILMPAQSFGQPIATIGMFMHDSLADTFNPLVSKQDQKPPMALSTKNGLYKIELTWEPVEIKPNQIVMFDLKITDALVNKAAENVHYDFVVVKDDQTIKELKSSFALNGAATHAVEFPSSGSFRVIVNILGVGDGVKHQNESVAFDLKVVPEFPIGTVIVMATLVGITIALTRFTVLNKNAGKNIQ